MNCRKCGKELIPLEVYCLAKEFSTTEKHLDEMASEFKKHGCLLFMDE